MVCGVGHEEEWLKTKRHLRNLDTCLACRSGYGGFACVDLLFSLAEVHVVTTIHGDRYFLI